MLLENDISVWVLTLRQQGYRQWRCTFSSTLLSLIHSQQENEYGMPITFIRQNVKLTQLHTITLGTPKLE